MVIRVIPATSTASSYTSSYIVMPRQGTLDPHGGPQPLPRTVLIGSRPAAFPLRAQQTARPSSPLQKPIPAPRKILSSNNAASSVAPRASVKRETDLNASSATESLDGNVSAVTAAPSSPEGKVSLLKKYSAEFHAKYPEIVGHCDAGIFVEGPDGKIRRFPPDKGDRQLYLRPPVYVDGMTVDEFKAMHDGLEKIGKTFVDQSDVIYDARQECIHEKIAGYAIHEDEQGMTVQFEVGGKPVSPICEDPIAFALGNGQYMIQQPEFTACTYAAEEMVLAEGLTEQEVVARLRDPRCKLNQIKGMAAPRRRDDYVRRSMEFNSGRKTRAIEGDDLKSQEVIQNLKAELAEHGPCIFSVSGHARVLDAIEETADGPLLTLRDPFTASVLKSKPDETFWTYWNENTPNYIPGWHTKSWTATFLTKEPAKQAKSS